MVKEVSSDYKKVGKRWFFKEPLAKWFFYGIVVKNLLSTFIFKSVQTVRPGASYINLATMLRLC